MSVVHFYYFLQLKIIWAIKLKPKFIFFPQMFICLAIRWRVPFPKFNRQSDTWKYRKPSSLWAEVLQGLRMSEERGFVGEYLLRFNKMEQKLLKNTSFSIFAFECSQESVKSRYLQNKKLHLLP